MRTNRNIQVIVILASIFAISGCQTSKKKVEFRHYFQDMERVDTKVEGTAGNWQAAPAADDRLKKNTRKIYVMEFSQEADESDDLIYAEGKSAAPGPASAEDEKRKVVEQPVPAMPDIQLPSFDGVEPEGADQAVPVAPVLSSEYTEYKVEKDDSLQKISKEFYGSFNKWTKIYEANKDQIKNPDFLQPGITIKIPKE